MRALTLLIVLMLAVESVSIHPSPSGVSVPAQEGVTAAVGFEPTESSGGCGLPRDCHRPTPPLRVPVQPLRHVAVGAIVTPIRGTATYFCNADASRGPLSACTKGYPDTAKADFYAAAGPALRTGDWRGRVVTVTRNGYRPIQVRLIDFCRCDSAVIDLYADAMWALGGTGRIKVSVSIGGGRASVTPPPTDIEGELP